MQNQSIWNAIWCAIEEGDLMKAQILLRNEARTNPCIKSFQNLGVFYAKEGLQLHSGRGRKANHIAKNWLYKALQLGDSKGIRWTLGYMAVGESNPGEALPQFAKAYTLQYPDWNSAYHCALCNCMLHSDAEMLLWSRKMDALDAHGYKEDNDDMLAYSLFLADRDSLELREHLNQCCSYTKFIILSLLGDSDAILLADEVWEKYALGVNEIALLFHTWLPNHFKKAKECLLLQQERLLEQHSLTSYKESTQIGELFYNVSYRKSYISNWRPRLPVLKLDCYTD